MKTPGKAQETAKKDTGTRTLPARMVMALSLATITSLILIQRGADAEPLQPSEESAVQESSVDDGHTSLYLEYVELPGYGHLKQNPASTSLTIYAAGNNYLCFSNMGYDFQEIETLANAIKKDPRILFPGESMTVTSTRRIQREGASDYILLEGSSAKYQWVAAVLSNRRFRGPEEEPTSTASILFLAGPDLTQERQPFLEALQKHRVHNTLPGPYRRFHYGFGGYSLELPESFFPSDDVSGTRLTAPNGSFLILDHHPVDEDVVLTGEMEKWKTRIEKGYYGYLFARGDHRIEKSETLDLKSGIRVIRMKASAMLPGPYGASSYARFYIFSTNSGVGIIVTVGAPGDPRTMDRIENSIRIEDIKAPLGLER
ncbi:MAG: hypothetical protein KDK25_02785 [Leptospiraceae bacterium]|nr:hypothetical protein [Leptospiraceae bacterium]